MKLNTKLKSLLPAALLCLGSSLATAQPIGQWDFKTGDLSATIGSSPLQANGSTGSQTVFGSTAALGLPAINGTNANVMGFPASDSGGGYNMPVASGANGGGSLVNNYTIVMDVLFKTNGVVRPLVQTDDGIVTPDADLVVDSTDGIGAPPGPYSGSILQNTWYRLAFSVNSSTLSKYINGTLVGTQPSGGTDNRLALDPDGFAQLFQNSTLNGAAPGFVSSIQIWATNLNSGQISALGGPSASKIPSSIPIVPSFIVTRTPDVNITNAPPNPAIIVVLNAGSGVIASNTISLEFDGSSLTSDISYDGTNYTITADVTNFLSPFSLHVVSLVYSDSLIGLQTNSWSFNVGRYQNVTLPAPIYFESFDEVAEGGIPAGWVVTNWTDTIDPGLNLFDTQSDSYDNWVTINTSDYATVYPDTDDYSSPGFPTVSGNRRQMIPPIVENGVLLTNLASGNLIVAESDQRGGSQVQVMFTRDYDFTTHSNVYVSFHNLNEQNQDNICSVEYSIDQGATWQPLLYMLDDGTTDSDGSDVVTNHATGQIDVFATFNTARNDQAHGLSYGTYIGAAITTNLAPFIRPCRNDDPVQQKRIELFRLPLADHQPNVRMRFMQAGTGSWYFDIDNLGFYSIPQPIILQQPTPVFADFNGPATFSVVAGGQGLTYQWFFGGHPVAGATASSFTINNTTATNVGLYNVVVSNSVGVATSDSEQLSLVFTPVILGPPLDQNISVGESASFSVTARGGQPLFYQWLYNSNTIPGANGTSYVINNAQTNQTGAYQVLVSNAFSTVLSPVAHLSVFGGGITQDMVVHLTFDNTYDDATGRGNYATNLPNSYPGGPPNNPTFTNGFLGQAVHLHNNGTPAGAPSINNYLSIVGDSGYPSDLQFGSDCGQNAVDFSVSFWTKIFEQNDDQSFIGNKDWNSGGDPGWIVDTEGDGMKWNYRDNIEFNCAGEGNQRRDSTHVAPQMEDGGWHHVLVSFARHSVAKIYIDGALINTTALGTDTSTNTVGSVDTESIGYHVNLGQDGTGHYTDGGSVSHVDMLMDDLAVWRRVVTDQEALGIFNAGLNGIPVDQATTTNAGKLPVVQIQPQDTTVVAGATATFYAGVLGSPALSYQWYLGPTALADQTNATLSIGNVASTNAGFYELIVTNNFGAATSRIAQLTFVSLPTITQQPLSRTVSPGASATFSVVASSLTPLSYQWYFGTTAVLGATNSSYAVVNAQSINDGSYYCAVSNSGGSTNSSSALLVVFTQPLAGGVVAYLPFDGDYNDHSGSGNNGTPVGSPGFAPGLVGQALHFTTTADSSVINYVTLGYPAGLQFGTNDWSVSFWVNYTNQADDSPFISNKDWNSSGNVGWIVASQNGGNFRVNATGTSGTKQDVKPGTQVRDGHWHHIAVSWWRTGQYAAVYADGQLVATSPMTFSGSVDVATNSINIGQDGTGQYTDGGSAHIDGLIDEVILWNRAITPQEVTSLYTTGAAGASALKSPRIAGIVYNGNTVTLSWSNGVPPFTVQTKATLSTTNWSNVGTTTNQSLTVPASGSRSFFRISGSNN